MVKKKKKITTRKKKKKTYNLKSRITSALRKVWLWSPMRGEVVKRCKVGENYRCEKCRRLTDKVQIDHINTVVPISGFDNWGDYINRLFCTSDNLQGICKDCHDKLTETQRKMRKDLKEFLKNE